MKSAVSVAVMISAYTSPQAGLMLLKGLQIFDYIDLINVVRPENLASFLELFNQNILNILSNPFKKEELEDDTEYPEKFVEKLDSSRVLQQQVNSSEVKCQTHPLVQGNELSCHLVNSSGDIIFHLCCYLVLKLTLYLMAKCLDDGDRYLTEENSEKNQEKNTQEINKNEQGLNKVEDTEKQPDSDKLRLKKGQKNRSFCWKTTRLILKIDRSLGVGFYFNLFMAFQIDFLQGAFTNLRFIRIKSSFGWFNLVFSASILLLTITVLTLSFKKTKLLFQVVENLNAKRKEQNKPAATDTEIIKELKVTKGLKNWVFLMKEKRIDISGLQKFFFEFMIVREILAVFLVIFFIKNGYFQIVSLMLLTVCAIVMLVKFKPYKQTFKTVMAAIIESCYLLIYLLFFWLKITENSMSKESRYNNLGKTIIVIFILILFLYVVMGLVSTIRSVRKYCKKRQRAQVKGEEKAEEQVVREQALNKANKTKMADGLSSRQKIEIREDKMESFRIDESHDQLRIDQEASNFEVPVAKPGQEPKNIPRHEQASNIQPIQIRREISSSNTGSKGVWRYDVKRYMG